MNEWILASELLPDEDSRVLVYVEHPMYGKEVYYVRDVTIARYRNQKWYCKEFLGNRVIAWMRMPELPKAAAQKGIPEREIRCAVVKEG